MILRACIKPCYGRHGAGTVLADRLDGPVCGAPFFLRRRACRPSGSPALQQIFSVFYCSDIYRIVPHGGAL